MTSPTSAFSHRAYCQYIGLEPRPPPPRSDTRMWVRTGLSVCRDIDQRGDQTGREWDADKRYGNGLESVDYGEIPYGLFTDCLQIVCGFFAGFYGVFGLQIPCTVGRRH